MTNREAAEEIQKAIDMIRQDGKDWLDERDIPILEMAINALSAQPETHEERTETHGVCLDAIDRQAVFDALDNIKIPRNASWYPYYQQALTAVSKLPSAQPNLQPTCNLASNDCISRQAAMEEISKQQTYKMFEGEDTLYLDANDVGSVLASLPTAQPELIRINLNEPIKVKLTDWGKEIYYHQYDRTNQIAGREICKPRFPREDENGYTEFQLWCFIELYGMHMGMTLPNVIEPLEIVYER